MPLSLSLLRQRSREALPSNTSNTNMPPNLGFISSTHDRYFTTNPLNATTPSAWGHDPREVDICLEWHPWTEISFFFLACGMLAMLWDIKFHIKLPPRRSPSLRQYYQWLVLFIMIAALVTGIATCVEQVCDEKPTICT